MKQPSNYHQKRAYNLPRQSTPFIGRVDEIAEIIGLLADPACRLLNLVGAGGIGKTRLAIQAAVEIQDKFAHGVCFVPLQSVDSVDFLISAIADALNFSLSGQEEPRVQLLQHLQNEKMLLVLDNFEQLLGQGGTALITDILVTAAGVKLLITSREVLNLQEEWLYPVRGLPFPKNDQADDPATYGAVQLFVERTRRVRRGFSLADELADVIRICQLVEGMPLALELAASWTKTMRCRTIVAEIRRNLDFLATNLRNVPARHQSMQAVFDQSWQLLNEKEREVFKRLSVFRGGFRPQAAAEVTGATLTVLSTLVDKSLLRWEPDGRYQIHELLRQYAEEQLQISSEAVTRVYDLHCVYCADFLNQRNKAMNNGGQQKAAMEIEAELANIRAAWQWAVDQAKVAEISRSADSLYLFYQFQSRYQAGVDAFEKAVDSLSNQEATQDVKITLAELLVHQGWLYIRLGQPERAAEALEQSQAIYTSLNLAPPPRGMATDPLIPLGVLATIVGDYPKAVELGQQAQNLAEARNDEGNLMFAFYVLTSALLAQGRYQAARQAARQAYSLAKARNNRWFMAYCLNDLGNVARMLKNYPEAEQFYQASHALKKEFDDPEGMAVAFNYLGQVAFLQENYSEARQLYQQSLAIYREIGDQGGLAETLNGLGLTACAVGSYQEARQQFHQALEIAAETQLAPLILSILLRTCFKSYVNWTKRKK